MEFRKVDAAMNQGARRAWQSVQRLWNHIERRFQQHGDKFAYVGKPAVTGEQEVQELELLAESLHIDKQKVVEGEVRIRKEVITETQVLHVPVTREELVIERLGANGNTVEVIRGQRELRIPLSSERVIVNKEPVVAEVLRIARRTIQQTKRVSTTLRHEELNVSREGNARITGGEKDKAA